jgi:hypothetical protein
MPQRGIYGFGRFGSYPIMPGVSLIEFFNGSVENPRNSVL